MFLFDSSGRGFDSRHLHHGRGVEAIPLPCCIRFPAITDTARWEVEMSSRITHVIKRTGDVVPFTPERITNAIYRAAVAVGGRERSIAESLTQQVVDILEETTPPGQHPTVEEIQDEVEKVLIENGLAGGRALQLPWVNKIATNKHSLDYILN